VPHFLTLVETGSKRKQPPSSSTTPFSFSSSHVATLAAQAEAAALKKIEVEQAVAAKAKLPDFWLPSLTPTFTSTSTSSADNGIPQSIEEAEKKMESAKTMCRGGGVGGAHVLSWVPFFSLHFCTFSFISPKSVSHLSPNANETPTTQHEKSNSCQIHISYAVIHEW